MNDQESTQHTSFINSIHRPQRQSESLDAVTCALCGERARKVPRQTVQAMISVSLRSIKDGDYYFCRTTTCPMVYFSADGSSQFTTIQVREQVYQKEPANPNVKVCYCFQHTLGEIQTAPRASQDAIIADINAGIQAEQCACDLRNPQGTCCLGNVRRVVGEG